MWVSPPGAQQCSPALLVSPVYWLYFLLHSSYILHPLGTLIHSFVHYVIISFVFYIFWISSSPLTPLWPYMRGTVTPPQFRSPRWTQCLSLASIFWASFHNQAFEKNNLYPQPSLPFTPVKRETLYPTMWLIFAFFSFFYKCVENRKTELRKKR